MTGQLQGSLPEKGHTQSDPAPVSLFRHGNFLLFLSGQTLSRIGNGVYSVGMAWTVYSLTGSTAAMGTILAVNDLPMLVLLLFGGAVNDRVSRRVVIIVCDTAAALVLAVLAWAAAGHHLTLTTLMAGSLTLGAIGAFYRPAYSAMNRDLLRGEQLRAANAMANTCGNAAWVAGPALAGLIYSLGGPKMVFGFDSITFAGAVVAMIFTRVSGQRAKVASRGLLRELTEGLRYTYKVGWLRSVLLLSVIANFACLAPYFVLLPALVKSNQGNVYLLGVLRSVEVCAAIVGSVAIGRWQANRMRSGSALVSLTSLMAIGMLGLGLASTQAAVLFIGVILVGISLCSDVIENTLLQALVPQELLSRVYSVNMLISFLLSPIGYAVSGVIAHWVGPGPVFIGGAALLLAGCAAAISFPALRQLDTARV